MREVHAGGHASITTSRRFPFSRNTKGTRMPAKAKLATAAPKPQFTVVGDVFIWASDDPDLGDVRIPLKMKTRVLRRSKELVDDELAFMFFILDSVLGDAAEMVDEMDAGEMRAMFREWQKAWEARVDARYPES